MQNALTVSQITEQIKNILESTFREVWIQGEVSNFKAQSSGHLYFSLKDTHAQISSVMFRGSANQLKKMPKAGDKIIVRGEINVYGPRGNYQVIVREVHYVGIGELLLRLEELKRDIAKRGWFRPEHKQKLPAFPKTIGVVTSPTGAAVQDILNVLKRRSRGLHLVLNPVRVQGAEAASEIAQAIEQFNTHKLADVLIIGRGGGSLEDLWPFNEEIVAKAVFESKIPIIAAVGHETDHTIAEYVADVRAPTPSAAAELVMAETEQHLRFLEQCRQRIRQTLRHLTEGARHRLARFERHPLIADPYQLLGYYMQRSDEIRSSLDLNMQQRLVQARGNLERVSAHLQSINPKHLLKQGYTVLFDEEKRAMIHSKNELATGQTVRALLADGEKRLEVLPDE